MQLNCLHEIFFDVALESARALDAYYAQHGKPIGPLHGLPVSLKDQFHVKDVETTMGYVGWIGTFEGKTGTGREKVHESEMVKELRTLGAVLYCKTSVPHTLMSGETTNNIIGYTLNPKNRELTAGGSSGGEGALIGLRGCAYTKPFERRAYELTISSADRIGHRHRRIHTDSSSVQRSLRATAINRPTSLPGDGYVIFQFNLYMI